MFENRNNVRQWDGRARAVNFEMDNSRCGPGGLVDMNADLTALKTGIHTANVFNRGTGFEMLAVRDRKGVHVNVGYFSTGPFAMRLFKSGLQVIGP